ncbi:hypothetical protein BDR06DRAFT_639447 [Suillus hirtellus]|nr:hypothetical protein BDR06DRAFT_639447 [Suillus hirtellus]
MVFWSDLVSPYLMITIYLVMLCIIYNSSENSANIWCKDYALCIPDTNAHLEKRVITYGNCIVFYHRQSECFDMVGVQNSLQNNMTYPYIQYESAICPLEQ